jgi:hypothetical protein
VSPFLQCKLDRKKFPVTNIIVPLCRIKTMEKESITMQPLVLGRTLGGTLGPHSNI